MYRPCVPHEVRPRPRKAGKELLRQQVALEAIASCAGGDHVARRVRAAARERIDVVEGGLVFYAASLSKAVFGYLVANLVNEGIIDLDKPLQKYFDVPIPDLKFEKDWKGFKDISEDKRYENITARMCLSHTTGFPNWRWISRIGLFNPEGKL